MKHSVNQKNKCTMNHGLINAKYYKKDGKVYNEDLYTAHPDLMILKNYFSRLYCRDLYYVAMKVNALKIARATYPEITLKQLAEIINVENHTTVYHLEHKYKPPMDYKDFIKNFHHYIDNYLYPITEKNAKKRYNECFYTPTYIEAKATTSNEEPFFVGSKPSTRLPYGNKNRNT